MSHDFDRDYWERHWREIAAGAPGSMDGAPPHPYLMAETSELAPGTALDAGCGAGGEALWLALQGWRVTAADLSADALSRARRRAAEAGPGVVERLTWIEADLTTWEPGRTFDLVTTHYAHPTIPQLEFYDRIAAWVAPGGSLLVVGHLDVPGQGHGHDHGHDHGHGHGHGHEPGGHPAEASVTLVDVVARLDPAVWSVETAAEHARRVERPGGRTGELHDVVVRATRRAREAARP